MHPEVETILQELDIHRARFIAFCRALNDEEPACPVPGSDFIAPLPTIGVPVTSLFEATQAPPVKTAPPGPARERWDVDRWNQRRVDERRSRPLVQACQARVKG